MKSLKTSFLILSLFVIGGCDQRGPFERAGERTDRAVEDAAEGVEEMGDEVEQTVE